MSGERWMCDGGAGKGSGQRASSTERYLADSKHSEAPLKNFE